MFYILNSVKKEKGKEKFLYQRIQVRDIIKELYTEYFFLRDIPKRYEQFQMSVNR